MERKKPFVIGEFYHLYNRGVDKRLIFNDARDWKRFQNNLYIYNTSSSLKTRDTPADIFSLEREESLVHILAYALMPNHFHLIVQEKKKNGISSFMAKVLTSYSMYFNVKHDRSGPLMCRPFRSSHIDSDEYFRWVFAYVHLNPLSVLDPAWQERGIADTKRAQAFLDDYAHSSYPDYYAKKRKESSILEMGAVPFDVSEFAAINGLSNLFKEGSELGAFAPIEAFLSTT